MSSTVPIDPSIMDFFTLSEKDKIIVIRIGLQCLDKSKECSSEEWKLKLDELENSYMDKLQSSEKELQNHLESFRQYQQTSREMTNELIQDVRKTEYIKYESEMTQLKSSIQEKEVMITKLNSEMIDFTKEIDNRYNNRMSDTIHRYESKLSELQQKIEHHQLLQMDEIGRNNNSTIKGRDGELLVYSKLQSFFPRSEIEDTHNIPRRGDFIVRDDGLTIMIEIKNYSRNVQKAEIDKFYRDLGDVSNKDIQCAIFVSLKSGICNREDFAFEIYNNIPILFIHNLQNHMESLVIASGFFRMITGNDIDLTKKEIIDHYKQLSVTLKRNFTKQKNRVEKFCREQIESISEQELSIIGLYKKVHMKY